jgi:3-methyladenine DNA glycosylase AlkD
VGTALVDQIRRDLADAADPDRAVQQQRYMKSPLPFHGARMPTVRQVVRSALRAHAVTDQRDLTTTVLALWDEAAHREEWYAALAVLQAPRHRAWRDLTLLPLYDHLVVTGQWWDVVDALATHSLRELLAREPEQVARLMREWAVDDDLWRRRAALVCQVGAKADTDVSLLADVVRVNLDDGDFFVRKGIGWALRAYAYTDAEWVRAFVDAHRDRLSPLSLREATKHL